MLPEPFSRSRRPAPGAAAEAARFQDVVVPHLGDALALARWLTGNLHDAEDVVQDACLRALSGLATYEGRGAKPWLLAIVRNTCFTWLGKNRPRDLVLAGTPSDLDEIETQDTPHDEGPEAALIRKAEGAAVQAAIAAVPHPYREVLVLRDINGLSYKEIAQMLKAPIGTVMSRLARGRSLLAVHLGKAVA
jgi:RNA polymerase sigma-70 factor (ECF subfamily)